jgi:hypothetical protein
LGVVWNTGNPCEIPPTKEEIMSVQHAVVWRSD